MNSHFDKITLLNNTKERWENFMRYREYAEVHAKYADFFNTSAGIEADMLIIAAALGGFVYKVKKPGFKGALKTLYECFRYPSIRSQVIG